VTKVSCHPHCQTVATETTRYINVSTHYERATRSKTELNGVCCKCHTFFQRYKNFDNWLRFDKIKANSLRSIT